MLDVSKLTTTSVGEIALDAVYYAMTKGILMNKMDGDLTKTVHTPFSLLPTPFKKTSFDFLHEIQPEINIIINNIANNAEFINSSLEAVCSTDDFTKRMVDLYNKKRALSTDAQPYRLGLFRTDYMMDTSKEPIDFPKMVEINTISVSFAPFGTFTSDLHKYILNRYFNGSSEALPTYDSISGIVNGIKIAHEHILNVLSLSSNIGDHNSNSTTQPREVYTLMVVQEIENNQFDQRFIEIMLFEKFNIKMIRRTLLQVQQEGKLNPKNSVLTLIDPVSKEEVTISVVYFRAGYTPTDYPTEHEWEARELIEMSFAIKAPSIDYHLVGTKKIQQVLSDLSVLTKFATSPEAAKRVYSTFTGLYSLDQNIIDKAILDPQNYVLKPQREGGGNNFYGEDIPIWLNKLDSQEKRDAYILMDRIVPKAFPGFIISNKEVVSASLVSELGIFGVYFGTLDAPAKLNTTAGCLLRSKSADKDDGGVAAGVAILDSPLLY